MLLIRRRTAGKTLFKFVACLRIPLDLVTIGLSLWLWAAGGPAVTCQITIASCLALVVFFAFSLWWMSRRSTRRDLGGW